MSDAWPFPRMFLTMSRLRIVTPTLLALALLAWPLGAGAEVVPPGNSEVNQYTETLPGPTNDSTVEPPGAAGTPGAPGGQGSAGGGPGGGVIPDDTARELNQSGPDGRAAAALAQSNAPAASVGDARDVGGEPAGNPESFFDGVLSAVTGADGDDGLGILMLLILLGVAAAGIGHALLRRRARQAG